MTHPSPTLLAFTSTHGGTGQTAIATHVALGLARSGNPVLLVEMQLPSVAACYLPGMAEAAHTAAPVGFGSLGGDTRCVEDNLWHAVLDPANPERTDELLEWCQRGSSGDFWLVLDLPRNVDARRDLKLEPDVDIQVLRADPSSLVDLTAVAERDGVQIVLNQIDSRRPISQDIDRVLSTLLPDRIAARVHYDEALPEALGQMRNLYDAAPSSLAAKALMNLVSQIVATERPATPIVASHSGD